MEEVRMDAPRYCQKCGDEIEMVSLHGVGFTVTVTWASKIRGRDPIGRPYTVFRTACDPYGREPHQLRPRNWVITDSPAGGATSAEPSTAEPAESS